MKLIRIGCEIINLDAFVSARRSHDGHTMTMRNCYGEEISLKGDDAQALWEVLSAASSTPQEISNNITPMKEL